VRFVLFETTSPAVGIEGSMRTTWLGGGVYGSRAICCFGSCDQRNIVISAHSPCHIRQSRRGPEQQLPRKALALGTNNGNGLLILIVHENSVMRSRYKRIARPAAICLGFEHSLSPLQPISMLELSLSKRTRLAHDLPDRGCVRLLSCRLRGSSYSRISSRSGEQW
jgi:hypothetical protein